MTEKGRTFDVVVVGAGPAGIAAACEASQAGRSVALLDCTPWLGGQIWRAEQVHSKSALARRWLTRLEQSGATILTQTTIVAQPAANTLLAETPHGALEIEWDRLILSPGARELFVPFPGWTLPQVVGPGGLQAMTKAGLAIQGKRVVVAGSGPLLLAVAADLRKRGAKVCMIAEQTPWGRLAGFGIAVAPHPGKWLQGLDIGLHMIGVPYRCGWWPVRAEGDDQVRAVTLTNGTKRLELECDVLACAFGLVPNLELPTLVGCETEAGFVRVNDEQQTSRPSVYGAGEVTGIGGVDRAIVEGRIAGLSAIDRPDAARRLFRRRDSWQRFARMLEWTFALRDELKAIATPETIICRCEDVTRQQLEPHPDWRAAKLHTRCGMGACQGRICGSAVRLLYGWQPPSARPPVFPVDVGTLSDMRVETANANPLRKEHDEPSSGLPSHQGRRNETSASHSGLH
jgi:NADPH-dependent 2,4-dienoyl-CoA reductase/sulfur reductase-like enzyme